MSALSVNITVNEEHMNQIELKFDDCAKYVGEIIAETEKMRQIMDESYKGYASAGLNDYFAVLNQHLEVLKLCYEQLADYTDMTKEVSLMMDRLLGTNFFTGGAIK